MKKTLSALVFFCFLFSMNFALASEVTVSETIDKSSDKIDIKDVKKDFKSDNRVTPVSKTIFVDISAGNWAEDGVALLKQKGIMFGKTEDFFNGGDMVLRSDAIAIALRAIGEECGIAYDAPFADVEQGEWYAPCVSKAYSLGILKGDAKSLVRPKESITRAELTALLFRALKVEVPNIEDISDALLANVTFRDFDKTQWWAPYFYKAFEMGMIKGFPDDTVRPNANATRYELAVIVTRFLKALGKA